MDKFTNEFLKEIETASTQLKKHTVLIEEKENVIKNILNELEFITHTWSSEINKNQFGEVIYEFAFKLNKYISQQVAYIESYVDGKEFINQFEKSVIVAVFGNVNTGKSTLGNFISGRRSISKDIEVDVPLFYTYDFNTAEKKKGAKLIEEGLFQEGSVETTATIQYFTLKDGLTWVDTPGIHSINNHNEELAKKYVDFADLILFLVPSSSPGKADEIEELSRLIEKKKALLVAITKSDRTEQDVEDGKLVSIEIPKSEKDRRDQEGYIEKVLKEKDVYTKIKSAQFTSISVKLANRALEKQNSELFIQSGLPKLYKQIGSVLSSQAIELKMQRPIAQINSMIEQIIKGFDDQKGLNQLEIDLMSILKQSEHNKKKLKVQAEESIEILTSKSKLELDGELSRLKRAFESGAEVNSKMIGQAIERIIVSNFERVVRKKLSDVLADIHLNQIDSINIAMELEFRKNTKDITQEYYEVDTVERDPKGLIEHMAKFVFGVKYEEQKIRTKKDTHTITVGNNFSEILNAAQNELERQVIEIVNSSIEKIEIDYFKKNDAIIEDLLLKVRSAKSELEKLTIYQNEVYA